MSEPVIHYVANSSQPYVQFSCDEKWGYVWVTDSSIPGVYQADVEDEPRRSYTFEVAKVTCAACLATVQPTPPVDPEKTVAMFRRLVARGLMNPGSDAALGAGCLCPVIDNGHGKGVEGRFIRNLDCELHGKE